MPKTFQGEEKPLSSLAFLFLFAPNNSGSTVLSQYLAEQAGAYLPPFSNNEGQAAPAVRDMMMVRRRWKPGLRLDWRVIRRAWEGLARGRLFIEASPPNILRAGEIAQVFGADSTALLSICDPYQQIASSLRRYYRPGRDLRAMGHSWVRKATYIHEIQQQFPWFPLIRHDDVVADPAVVNRAFALPVRPSTVRGKRDSGAQGVTDMRAVTTLFLTKAELDAASEALAPHAALLAHFGYRVDKGARIIERLAARTPGALDQAQARRRAWEDAPG